MLKKGSYFSEQDHDEKVVLFIRRHWLAFLPWIVIIFMMILIPAILIIVYGSQVPELFFGTNRAFLIVGVGSYLLITLAVFLTAWTGYYLNVAIITPEHLVDIRQSGLFNRKVSEQSLLRVQDVSARITGIMQTFFRYGMVFVETAGEAPNFEMLNIPLPNKIGRFASCFNKHH